MLGSDCQERRLDRRRYCGGPLRRAMSSPESEKRLDPLEQWIGCRDLWRSLQSQFANGCLSSLSAWLSWDSAQARSAGSPLLVQKGRSRSAKPVSELNRVIGTRGVNPRLPLHFALRRLSNPLPSPHVNCAIFLRRPVDSPTTAVETRTGEIWRCGVIGRGGRSHGRG